LERHLFLSEEGFRRHQGTALRAPTEGAGSYGWKGKLESKKQSAKGKILSSIVFWFEKFG